MGALERAATLVQDGRPTHAGVFYRMALRHFRAALAQLSDGKVEAQPLVNSVLRQRINDAKEGLDKIGQPYEIDGSNKQTGRTQHGR